MITDQFNYYSPRKISDLTTLLTDKDETIILGGGTWVVPKMTEGEYSPKRVIDLKNAGLSSISEENGELTVGAMTTYSEIIDTDIKAKGMELLYKVAKKITGGAQIRNYGSVGGSACYANPSSDIPACLVSLDAKMKIVSANGEREVKAKDFFIDAFETDIRPNEVLCELKIPNIKPDIKIGYYKLKFGESSWPIATAICLIKLDTKNICKSVKLVLGGICSKPLVVDISSILVDFELSQDKMNEIKTFVEQSVTQPWEDVLASGEYRKSVAGVVAKRALLDAMYEDN